MEHNKHFYFAVSKVKVVLTANPGRPSTPGNPFSPFFPYETTFKLDLDIKLCVACIILANNIVQTFICW